MSETTVRVAEGPALVLAGYEGEPLRSLESYRAVGGYAQLEQARTEDPQAVIQQIVESNLRGRGGAFFPTGRKASFIPTPDKIARPIYITVNADESEPGTFKDREIMLKVPHRLLEGCLIAAHAIQSKQVFIYVRGEYLDGVRVAAGRARRGARGGDPRQRRHRDPPRRGRLHLRRGDRAARVARGQARPAALEAAVPGDLRRLRVADADQQRRVDHDDPGRPRGRPGGVREDRRPARLDRHAPLLPLGQRRAARRLRGAARDHGAAPDLRDRRRRARRPHAEGRDDGRLVVPGHDAGRPRHAARRRLARQEGLLHRLGRRQRHRRADVHRAVRAAGRAVLHARVVRQVHAVPRRHALARPATARGRGRNRDPSATSTSRSTSATGSSASASACSATRPRCRSRAA